MNGRVFLVMSVVAIIGTAGCAAEGRGGRVNSVETLRTSNTPSHAAWHVARLYDERFFFQTLDSQGNWSRGEPNTSDYFFASVVAKTARGDTITTLFHWKRDGATVVSFSSTLPEPEHAFVLRAVREVLESEATTQSADR